MWGETTDVIIRFRIDVSKHSNTAKLPVSLGVGDAALTEVTGNV